MHRNTPPKRQSVGTFPNFDPQIKFVPPSALHFRATPSWILNDAIVIVSPAAMAGGSDMLKKNDELAAFRGRAGGKLLTVNPDTGETVNTVDVNHPPVFDGLIAAQGHLYMCTTDGSIIRF